MRTAIVLLGAVVLLGGCIRTPVELERREKEALDSVARRYRPGQQKPELPVLNAGSDLSEFVRYALLNSPRVEAAFYAWKSSVDAIAAARYLPSPTITLEAEISGRLESLMLTVMGMSPPLSRLVLEVEAASLEARGRRLLFERELLRTAFAVREAALQMRLAEEKERTFAGMLANLGLLEEIGAARVRSGTGATADVISVQIERARVATMRDEASDSGRLWAARFRSALGEPRDRPVPAPSVPALPAAEISEEGLWAGALRRNPDLARMENEVRMSENAVRMAYREYFPDFGAGLMRSFFSGMAMTRPMLTLMPSWRGKVRARVASASGAEQAVRARLSSEELDLAVMLADGMFRWRQACREVDLYEDGLAPKARLLRDLATAAYRSGAGDAADVLRAEESLLEFTLSAAVARAMRAIALEEIGILVAGGLPERALLFEEVR